MKNHKPYEAHNDEVIDEWEYNGKIYNIIPGIFLRKGDHIILEIADPGRVPYDGEMFKFHFTFNFRGSRGEQGKVICEAKEK